MFGQYETQQYASLYAPANTPQLWALTHPQFGHATQAALPGLGQAAFGQAYGQAGGQPFGQTGAWGQHRQLSPQDANEVVRQLIPLLPQVIAQAQQQPMAAIGSGQRMLTQQDVNEVVRQILPIVPQIVAQLQGQSPMHAGNTGYGLGMQAQMGMPGQSFSQPFGQQPFGQQTLGQQSWAQQPYSQQAWPQFQAAIGGSQAGIGQTQRQLSQQDVSEVVRQLVGVIPNVISNLQASQQQAQPNSQQQRPM